MSDVEHELLGDVERAAAEVRKLRATARRALVAARDAQDGLSGAHEDWIDDALAEVGGP